MELAQHVGLILLQGTGEDQQGVGEGGVMSNPSVRHLLQLHCIELQPTTDIQWEAYSLTTGHLTFSQLEAKDVMTSQMSSQSQDKDSLMSELTVPGCVAPTVFTSDLLVAMGTEQAADWSADDDVTANRIVDVAYAVGLCRCLVGNRKEV